LNGPPCIPPDAHHHHHARPYDDDAYPHDVNAHTHHDAHDDDNANDHDDPACIYGLLLRECRRDC
jgi:hypothetical protein